MTRMVLMVLTAVCCATAAYCDAIQLPADNDDYSKLVAQAAAHANDVDFRALRLAYVKSAAYQRAGTKIADITQARKEIAEAMQAPDGAATVRAKTEQILSIDYTDMQAHKILRQACEILHDDACADEHHFVEFGLLNSILHTGDGKTCATGWQVVQIGEEYFILGMLNTKLTRQALVSEGGHACDRMDVTDESGAARSYFFNVDIVMAAEQAALEHR